MPRRQDAAAQAHPPASSFSWFRGICFWTKSASQFQVNNWIRPPMRPASEPALSGVQIKPKFYIVHRFHKGLFLGARSRAATGASLGLVLASVCIHWHPLARPFFPSANQNVEAIQRLTEELQCEGSSDINENQ